MIKQELLAPAGSFDTLKAVLAAGADAAYLGGPAFGARAYAGNFTEEELLLAIDYAHLRKKKLYLTVNTLLKNQEMDRLYDYILPYYQAGLDGILVQDMGVLRLLRECFPSIELHSSTQMTITSEEGAAFLKEEGISRVVMARELSIAEMARIRENTGMEIEAFVHGALCYCYSGQCLFSGMIGGRSGNRGRCAQPCRLPYSVDGKKDAYILSLKDFCGVLSLRELADAGVYSLKIEGRMKSTAYAAGVVAVYRQILDRLHEDPCYRPGHGEYGRLMELGSRCGFTDAYLHRRNGKDMVTFSRPNFTVGTKEAAGEQTGQKDRHALACRGTLKLLKGQPAEFTVRFGETKAAEIGMVPMPAQKKPLLAEDVKSRMSRTGDTRFDLENLDLTMDEDIFLPNGELNRIRRAAFSALEEALLAKSRRADARKPLPSTAGKGCPEKQNAGWSILCSCREQLAETLRFDFYDRIYMDWNAYREADFRIALMRDADALHKAGKEFYLALPEIMRAGTLDRIRACFSDGTLNIPDGFLVRNYEELGLIRKKGKCFVTDHSLYTYNDRASEAFLSLGASYVTMPYELNRGEIRHRQNDRTEMVLYGYYPMMVSAGCLQKNTAGCINRPGTMFMTDRTKQKFPIRNLCRECFNLIYNALPTCLLSCREELKGFGISRFRIVFTVEDQKEVSRILAAVRDGKDPGGRMTAGHYKRGVE